MGCVFTLPALSQTGNVFPDPSKPTQTTANQSPTKQWKQTIQLNTHFPPLLSSSPHHLRLSFPTGWNADRGREGDPHFPPRGILLAVLVLRRGPAGDHLDLLVQWVPAACPSATAPCLVSFFILIPSLSGANLGHFFWVLLLTWILLLEGCLQSFRNPLVPSFRWLCCPSAPDLRIL